MTVISFQRISEIILTKNKVKEINELFIGYLLYYKNFYTLNNN